jgi:hypothetical protein
MNKYKFNFLVIFDLKVSMGNTLIIEKSLKKLLSPLILDQKAKIFKALFYTLHRFECSRNHLTLLSL